MKKIYLLATVIAIITGIAVFIFATELQNSNNPSVQTNMVTVVVAAVNIPENSTITAEMLTTAQFSEGSIPVTAVKDPSFLIGKVAKYLLIKGEQFLTTNVFVIGDKRNIELADRIKSDFRAFTLSVDEINGIEGYLRVGDKVDIIISKPIDGVPSTLYIVQDVSIVAVGNASQYVAGTTTLNQYSNITLEVSADECPMLYYNLLNGLVKIVLRGYGDDEIVTTPTVDK